MARQAVVFVRVVRPRPDADPGVRQGAGLRTGVAVAASPVATGMADRGAARYQAAGPALVATATVVVPRLVPGDGVSTAVELDQLERLFAPRRALPVAPLEAGLSRAVPRVRRPLAPAEVRLAAQASLAAEALASSAAVPRCEGAASAVPRDLASTRVPVAQLVRRRPLAARRLAPRHAPSAALRPRLREQPAAVRPAPPRAPAARRLPSDSSQARPPPRRAGPARVRASRRARRRASPS